MIRKTALAPVFVVCWALSLSAAASGDQTPPSAPQGPAASAPQGPATGAPQAPKKPELGAWWQKNAMEYKPLPSRWLFPADGTLSYMNASGNTSGSTLDISANAEVRKDRFTSNSFVQMTRKDMVYGFSQVTRGSGCVPVAGGLHCNLDLLGAAAGDISPAEVVIGTNVTAVGEVTLTATAAFNETDPTPTDNTLVLKANTPAPVVPPVPTPPTLNAAAVKPVFGIPRARPRAPTAGKRFTLTLPVKHGDTDKLLATALLAGRRVRHSTTFAGGTARLSLLLPKTAKGKLLKLQLTATTVGQVVNRTFTYRVH